MDNTEHSKRQSRSKDFLQYYIGKTAKYFVVFVVCLFILLSESILPIYYVMGGVANSILSKILKLVIRQPRPKHSPKGGHGMPSSHSQSISYFATVLEWKIFTFVLDSWPTLGVSQQHHPIVALLLCTVILMYSYYAWWDACLLNMTIYWLLNWNNVSVSFVFSSYRISTGRHTLAQTVVGAVVGALTGSSAYFLETRYLRVYLPEDLFPMSPLWLRCFIVGTGVVVLFRKDIAKKLFNHEVDYKEKKNKD